MGTTPDLSAQAPAYREHPVTTLSAHRDNVAFSIFDICHYPYDTNPAAFEPHKAQQVYAEHLSEWVAAEHLGYDAIFLAEHHFTAYNLLPTPNVMLAALAVKTDRIRIGNMINVVPFHDPRRLAEDTAMVDLLSGGRLEIGVGRGVDYQEVQKMGLKHDELRSRFQDGVDLMVKAWSNVEFEHDGPWYKLGRTSIYPRPLQTPHPPIWVAAESQPTIEWTAQQGWGMSSLFVPTDDLPEKLDRYLTVGQAAGHDLTPAHFMLCRNVYVAPTDHEAIAEAEIALAHLMRLVKNAAFPPDLALLPDSYAYHRELFGRFTNPPDRFQDIIDSGLMLCGSPETVRSQLADQVRAVGMKQFMCWFAFGNLTHQQVMRSMTLFATEVAPHIRQRVSAPS